MATSAYLPSEPRGIGTIRFFAEQLENATLPPLKRPFFTQTSPRTKEVVQWGICMYAYPVAAHLRMVLSGLRDLAERRNNPACGPLARHLFEWAAATCYLFEDVAERFRREDWQGAWDTLTNCTIGSGWIKKFGNLYTEFEIERNTEVPVPPTAKKCVASYERYFKAEGRDGSAIEEYSHLCDHSHPTSSCLTRYRHDEFATNTTTFGMLVEHENLASFLPSANVSTIDLLMFFNGLLGLAGETSLRETFSSALQELARHRAEMAGDARSSAGQCPRP